MDNDEIRCTSSLVDGTVCMTRLWSNGRCPKEHKHLFQVYPCGGLGEYDTKCNRCGNVRHFDDILPAIYYIGIHQCQER